MRLKEVSAIAEERMGASETRLAEELASHVRAAEGRSDAAHEALLLRMASLEAAVQQEQRSSLHALQAILDSSAKTPAH